MSVSLRSVSLSNPSQSMVSSSAPVTERPSSPYEEVVRKIDRLLKEEFVYFPTTFEDPLGTVVVWSSGEAVILTESLIGRGLTKSVYEAVDPRSRKIYAAAFVDKDEIEAMEALKNKRGIAQISNHMVGRFGGKPKHMYYGERYDTDLERYIPFLRGSINLEDAKVIVKDLVYAIIALEGEDPLGDWIAHYDIKDANIFLKIDKITGRILGAYLGDFGRVGTHKTVLIDEKTLAEQMKKFGCPRYPLRETQRKRFISSVFHQIRNFVNEDSEKLISLEDLCADDPVCKKLMGEMEKKYSYILERPYFHWQD